MNDLSRSKVHIESMMGIFVGKLNDNALHKHYAMQISIAANGKLDIADNQNNHNHYSTCFINSNVEHQFTCNEMSLIILINPISSIGHQLYIRNKAIDIAELNEDLMPIREMFVDYLEKKSDFGQLTGNVGNHLRNYTCKCEVGNHVEDDRIYKAIQYLEQNFDRIVSLKEISSTCFLSETRFLHLFKDKTKLNFRRYQLWNKLVKSLPYLKTHSITETAHRFGFTDSSHYSRTFKETFGVKTRFLSSLN
ncbi:helix-turn-helix domain-containing protein [Sphingobacterium tabacisoli]|uniref:Helix-turn-helix domain-containing protein n=2 Tax=Sphingobacterium tabacisoli TaxID=2044855 RepID=A0ABW5L9F4_9SPHI